MRTGRDYTVRCYSIKLKLLRADGEDAVTFFIFRRGFGLIVVIVGLDRGTCKLVEVQFFGWTLYMYRRTV